VTPLRRSRRRLRPSSEIDLLALFENASDIVLLNDRSGRIVMANRAARELAGYSEEDIEQGVSLQEVLSPAEYEAAMLLTERALDGQPIPAMYEREAAFRDGRRRLFELRSNMLQLANGERLLQTIGRDVTDSRRAAAFQASLVQVSQALLTTSRPEEVGELICDEARRALEVDGAYLWLQDGNDLVVAAAAGMAAGQMKGLRRETASSVIGDIFRRGGALTVHDLPHTYPHWQQAQDLGVQAMLAVPLSRQGEKVGVLVFTHNTDAQFFRGAVADRALILAAQASVAVSSTLARQREEEEGRVSAALLQVARAISESLEETDVLERIVQSAREVLRCDWTIVSLWSEARQSLQVATGAGWPPELLDEMRLVELRLDMFPELSPILEGQPFLVTEPEPVSSDLYRRWGVASFFGVPMKHAGGLIGAFGIGFRQRHGPFSAYERRISEGVAAQAAVAVNNARLVEHLRHANRLKSEFLGTMSHELRTPLAAMLGYTELLRDGVMGELSEEQAQALDRMLINGRGLLELINTTLDVNRLEAGRVTVDKTSFVLADLIEELATEYSARPLPVGLELRWPGVRSETMLHNDRNKLKVILRNLIDNALKYTVAGSVTIEASTSPMGERLDLAVRDTGVGIPPEALQTIFEMFRQLDNEGRPPRSGVGLGLYLVRRYVQLLGGDVRVDSRPGYGSTFTVELPLARGGDGA
jgi:PAS domain S-box-containing protein